MNHNRFFYVDGNDALFFSDSHASVELAIGAIVWIRAQAFRVRDRCSYPTAGGTRTHIFLEVGSAGQGAP